MKNLWRTIVTAAKTEIQMLTSLIPVQAEWQEKTMNKTNNDQNQKPQKKTSRLANISLLFFIIVFVSLLVYILVIFGFSFVWHFVFMMFSVPSSTGKFLIYLDYYFRLACVLFPYFMAICLLISFVLGVVGFIAILCRRHRFKGLRRCLAGILIGPVIFFVMLFPMVFTRMLYEISWQRKINLYETDHKALRDACRELMAIRARYDADPNYDADGEPIHFDYWIQYGQNGYMNLPEPIRRRRFSYIEASDDQVKIEYGGGFHHYGFVVTAEGVSARKGKELIDGLWYYDEGLDGY